MPNNETNESREPALPSSRYSDKLTSLLSFLEEHCDQNNDSDDELSVNNGGREAGASTSNFACTGLADITNQSPSTQTPWYGASERREALADQDEEELKDINDRVNESSKARGSSARSHVMREKKYIWDDWSETEGGDMVLLQDASRMEVGDNLQESATCAPSKGLPANAHQQLQELKSLSLEIQTRAAAMKIQLEKKKSIVEELHSIRVKNESEHVQKMKSVKQQWKKRLECVKSHRDCVLNKHEKLEVKLQTDCESLEKTVAKVKSDIESTVKSEHKMCERLKRDRAHDLEEARKSWQNAEREELKKRDQKMSPKLKRDAAKAVEPKLRQLMGNNKEEIERLERESTLELDCYKLELYTQANAEFKREMNNIRTDERKRMETLEIEWIAKMESSRREHESETKKLRNAHEQRAMMMKRQFNADVQRCIDEHDVVFEDAQKADELDLQQIRGRHEHEMNAMEEEYSENTAQRQASCKEEFERWKIRRDTEMKEEEKMNRKDEHAKMKNKIQSNIDLVKRKLKEEQMETRQQAKIDIAKRNMARKEEYDTEIQRLEKKIEQATKESAMLQQKEDECSQLINELQNKLTGMEESFRNKESLANKQRQRLAALVKTYDQQVVDIQQDGERKIARARNEKEVVEKMLDNLIANHPKQKDERARELEDLKANNVEEMKLAETKVHAMIKNKASRLKGASAKLFDLREETAEVDEKLHDARKIKVLGKCTSTRHK